MKKLILFLLLAGLSYGNSAFAQSDSTGVFKIMLDSASYKNVENIKMDIKLNANHKQWLKKTVGDKKNEEIMFFYYINNNCGIDSVTFLKDYGTELNLKLADFLKKFKVELYQNNTRLKDCTVLETYYPLHRIAARLKYF